jgi:hypothetical protein
VGDGVTGCTQQERLFTIKVAGNTYTEHGAVDHVFYGYVGSDVTPEQAKGAAFFDATGARVREGDFLNGGGATFFSGDGTVGNVGSGPGLAFVPEGKQLIFGIEYVLCDGTRRKDPARYLVKP